VRIFWGALKIIDPGGPKCRPPFVSKLSVPGTGWFAGKTTQNFWQRKLFQSFSLYSKLIYLDTMKNKA
jgi:hypothetical protein